MMKHDRSWWKCLYCDDAYLGHAVAKRKRAEERRARRDQTAVRVNARDHDDTTAGS